MVSKYKIGPLRIEVEPVPKLPGSLFTIEIRDPKMQLLGGEINLVFKVRFYWVKVTFGLCIT